MERFWSKVDKTGNCWLWTGAKTGRGYGKINIGGRYTNAHRVAYEMANGPIPEGWVVRHKCDVRACCNPEHLELGTHADNARDKVERGRHVGLKKLSDADVQEIRARLAAGDELQREIAADYGVTQELVSKIKHGHRDEN